MIQDCTTRSIMTFYWWSHWFWITLLSYLLLLITVVHTYPSQDKILEYNPINRESTTNTKLFHSEATIEWSTMAPTSTQVMELTESKFVEGAKEKMDEHLSKEVEDIEEVDTKNTFQNNGNDEEQDDYFDDEKSKEFEYKRSAENKASNSKLGNLKELKNDTHASAIPNSRKPTVTMTEDDSRSGKPRTEDKPIFDDKNKMNRVISNVSSNVTETNKNTGALEPVQQSLPSAPSEPLIDAEPSAAEWLKTIVAQLPPPVVQQNPDDISINMVTTSDGSQKIPFTLENVNREDELRRAENEHRTRKSKVLSAEYKHINRYINYSTDPKSLLTRSASASPNDFENDSESNISSEALSIQRTYFLDAGSISAICFTVFGVCCTVGTIGTVLYRRRYLNKPQTLSEPDSSVYIDDSTMRVSDNSDEMYSLDNDSFLNSLEAMTIQNYWTDTVKHTKL